MSSRKSFTLIELLIVLAIVAILSVVVVLTLNPAELLKQARDSTRLSDMSTVNTALGAFSADVSSGFMGTSSIVYVSIADTTTTCANLGLPALPSGWNYNCATAANLKKADGTGWLPVNFTQITFGSPISSSPVDPQNTTTTQYYTYVAGGSWQLSAKLESQKYQPQAATTNSYDPGLYVVGTNTSLAPFVGGLVGWWKFDEGSGTSTLDSSGFGNNGTASGTAVVAGQIGSARSFNGTNSDRVTVPNNSSLSPAYITMTAWIKPSGATGFVLSKESQYRLITNGSMGNLSVMYAAPTWGTTALGSAFSIGAWQMISATFDGSAWNLYLNGTLNTSKSQTGQLVSTGNILTIGSYSSGGGYVFSGLIDDVRIYNRALSAAEVSALYNATK